MADVRERVRRLIALATGPTTPVEEARTAAMVACRMIQEHGLLGTPSPRPATPQPARPPAHNVDIHWYTVDPNWGGSRPQPRPAAGPEAHWKPRTGNEGSWDEFERRIHEMNRERQVADQKAYAKGYDGVDWTKT